MYMNHHPILILTFVLCLFQLSLSDCLSVCCLSLSLSFCFSLCLSLSLSVSLPHYSTFLFLSFSFSFSCSDYIVECACGQLTSCLISNRRTSTKIRERRGLKTDVSYQEEELTISIRYNNLYIHKAE